VVLQKKIVIVRPVKKRYPQSPVW